MDAPDVGGWDSLPSVADAQTAAPEKTETEVTASPADDTTATVETQIAPPTPTVPAKATKTFSFKVGDKDVPVEETATYIAKIDGKDQPVALKDLVQNYAGKIPWERKYQELSNERKKAASEVTTFEQTRQRHAQLITNMHKSAAEGKVFDAVSSMLEMTGLDKKIDAREYVRNLRGALMEQAKQLNSMDEHQRALYEANEERDYLKSRNERLTQLREQEQAQSAFQERVAKAVQDSGATLQEYVQTRDWLVQTLKAKNGDVNQVTPEFVTNHIRDVRDYQVARDALTAIDPELIKNEKLWDQAVYFKRQNPDWTQEDLTSVFREAAEQKRSKAVSQKVAKAPVATVASVGTKPKTAPRIATKPSEFGAFTSEDLDW